MVHHHESWLRWKGGNIHVHLQLLLLLLVFLRVQGVVQLHDIGSAKKKQKGPSKFELVEFIHKIASNRIIMAVAIASRSYLIQQTTVVIS